MGWLTKQWPPVRGLNPVRQLKWTTLTCINPSMFFAFFSSVTKNTTRFILKIQNPSLEIKRDPSHVTFFNIGHEARREIDNIKCPSVYRLTQIPKYIFHAHQLAWLCLEGDYIYRTCTSIFYRIVLSRRGKPFFFNWFSYIPNEFYRGDLLQRWLLIIGCWVLKWDPKNKRRLIHLTKFKFLIVFLKIGLKSI